MRLGPKTDFDINPFNDWDGTCDLCKSTIPPHYVWVVDDNDLATAGQILCNVLYVCASCTKDGDKIRQHLQQVANEAAPQDTQRAEALRRMADSRIVSKPVRGR